MTSHNTVVLKELDSRSLAISKDYETIEVTMPKMDRTEPEEIAEVSSYAVLGFQDLSLQF